MTDQPCHCLLCEPPSAEDTWDAREQGIAQNIREFGWSVNGVAGGHTPDWAYTAGLWHTLRQPEICVFGLPMQTAKQILNSVGSLVRDGARLTDGQRRDDILKGYDVVVRTVSPAWYTAYFGTGCDFYQQPPMPMLQLLWPDRAGHFPWEAGDDSQPRLWLTPDEHPAGRWKES